MRRGLAFAFGLILAMLCIVPAYAVGSLTITAPADNATVHSPVRFQFNPNVHSSFTLRLEIAHGANATTDFRTTWMQSVKDAPRGADMYMDWDADGYSGGPYTMRISVVNGDTREVMTQGTRSFVLDAPDISPAVTWSGVPAEVKGLVTITGRIDGAAVTGWRLETQDALGSLSTVTSGTTAGDFKAAWNAAPLKDGPYTLRFLAWDKVGNVRKLEAQTRVSNPKPALVTAVFEAEPGVEQVPVTYSAVSAARIDLTIGDGAAAGTLNVDAGENARALVPVDLSSLAPGSYTAKVKAVDAQGRSDATRFTVRVLQPLPRPELAELPAFSNGKVNLRWTLPDGAVPAAAEVIRSGPDGKVTLAVANPNDLSLQDGPTRSGDYTYAVSVVADDGRRMTSMGRSITADLDPPKLGAISVAPTDGSGLNVRWDPAQDTAGVTSYEVYLIDGDLRRRIAQLRGDAVGLTHTLDEGAYSMVLSALDKAGNRAESDPIPFRVQKGAVPLMMGRKFLPTDVPGFIEDGRTWVPLRLFSEALGYEVLWNGAKQMATLLDKSRTRLVYITVGETELRTYIRQEEKVITLPGAPRNVGGRIMVPLRTLLEALGAQVKWHETIRTVEILNN